MGKVLAGASSKSSAVVMTKLSIEKIELSGKQTERFVYDFHHRRLALRLRRNAGGTYSYAWLYLYMFKGARRKIYIGQYPKCSIRQAHAEAERLSAEIASGFDPVQAKFELTEHAVPRTLGELYERWFHEVIKRKRARSHGHVAQIFRDHVFYSPQVRTIQLSSLKPHFVKNILERVLSKGKKRTLVMTLQLLKQMLRWAERMEFLERNPAMAFVDSDFVSISSRERFLTRPQIVQLITGLYRAQVHEQFISAILLILATGNRSTETRLVMLKDVDLVARTIAIPVENQKKIQGVIKKTHLVHLSDFALKHVMKLIDLAEGSDYLIPHLRYADKRFKQPISKSTLMQQLARHDGVSPHSETASLKIEGGRFTIHDLRRTAASQMQELGVSYEVVDKCQNHEIPGKVRRTYMRAEMRADMVSAWNKLGLLLEELEAEAIQVWHSEQSTVHLGAT